MPLEWIDDPITVEGSKKVRSSTVKYRVVVCPAQMVTIAVTFDPPNVTNFASVQVYFFKGRNTTFSPTKKVQFHSDGKIIGAGGTLEGVKFFKGRWDIRDATGVVVDLN